MLYGSYQYDKTNVELTTYVLLCGTEAVLCEVNAAIFKEVQRYIELSKRFNTMMLIRLDRFLDNEAREKRIALLCVRIQC